MRKESPESMFVPDLLFMAVIYFVGGDLPLTFRRYEYVYEVVIFTELLVSINT